MSATLGKTEDRLSDARSRAASRVASLSRQFDEFVVASADVATDDEHDPEGHTIAWERQQVAALLAKAQRDLAAIDAAVSRLGGGAYGLCLTCGDRIADDRLNALPGVTSCISCAL